MEKPIANIFLQQENNISGIHFFFNFIPEKKTKAYSLRAILRMQILRMQGMLHILVAGQSGMGKLTLASLGVMGAKLRAPLNHSVRKCCDGMRGFRGCPQLGTATPVLRIAQRLIQ